MPSDIAVTRVVAVPASVEAARDRPMPQVQPHSADRMADKRAPDAPAPPNPTMRLDPELEIVVLEFRDEGGQVRNTIPTEQQLAAYRAWDRTGHGDPAHRQGQPEAAAQRERQATRPVEAAGTGGSVNDRSTTDA